MPASCSRLTYFFAEQQTLSLEIKKKWAKAYNLNHIYIKHEVDQQWNANLMPIFVEI